jgi:hypothetical protein
MTSTPTAIDFPDPTDPGFDEKVPFEAPNGQSYLWNGYGWELVCEGIDTSDFLRSHGDEVEDNTEQAYYHWNEGVKFAANVLDGTATYLDLTSSTFELKCTSNGSLDAGTALTVTASGGNLTLNAGFESKLYAFQGNVILESEDANELIDRTITSSAPAKQITNKEYVDSLFDFSQYDELT